jgi:hypothetical protein
MAENVGKTIALRWAEEGRVDAGIQQYPKV